jgi:pimeloyl-ACP methyl ester carboxylesterase
MTSTLSKRARVSTRPPARSCGGRALIEFALTYPERVRSLALVERGAYWILEELTEQDALVRELNEFIHGLASKEVSEDHLARFLGYAGFVEDPAEARQHSNWERWVPLSWQSEKVVRSGRSVEDLSSVTCPVLLVKGTVTKPWLKRVVDVLGERIPEARIVELPGDHAAWA